jgi:hypothetical protein
MPLSSSVSVWSPAYSEVLVLTDAADGGFDQRSFGFHCPNISTSDIVHVCIQRKPRNIEHEQVECGAALQCQSRAKKGVICQTLQEAKQ